MRHSNYIFTKGAIVFIKSNPSSKDAYLSGRPLIVVSNPSHILNTLIVCPCGTQDKPGIEISLYNYREQKYIGDNEISHIYPYSLSTIYSWQIVDCIGHLDPFIMDELDNAIDFHLGRTREIPTYLKDTAEYLTEVRHTKIKEKYITNEEVSKDLTLPPQHKVKTPIQKTSSQKSNVRKISHKEIDNWVLEASKNDIDMHKACNNPDTLIKIIDERSVALIVSRCVPIALIAKKYKINQREATFLRITLTNIVLKFSQSVWINDTKKKEYKDTPEYIFIGMLLLKAFAPEKLTDDTGKFNTYIDRVGEKYNIDTSNRRTWKSIENFYEK